MDFVAALGPSMIEREAQARRVLPLSRYRIRSIGYEAACEYCGYPFYVGDSYLYSARELAYCSRKCAIRVENDCLTPGQKPYTEAEVK